MAGVNGIDPAILNTVNGGGNRGKSEAEKLGTNFMTLLVAQLKNQDPLKPIENTELTSQLAQINTVSGIDSLNETLKSINGQISAGQQLQAAGLIGRGVMIPGDRVLVGNDGVTTPFGIELSRSASKVNVSIVSESGEVMRQFNLGAVTAGTETLVWDGLLTSGEAAAGGAYRVVVEAIDASDKAIDVTTLNYALVNAVSIDKANQPVLDLGGVQAPVGLGEVRQIL